MKICYSLPSRLRWIPAVVFALALLSAAPRPAHAQITMIESGDLVINTPLSDPGDIILQSLNGRVTINAAVDAGGKLTVVAAGDLDVDSVLTGTGEIYLQAAGTLLVKDGGIVRVVPWLNGRGGIISLFGDRVGVMDAIIEASGPYGGGSIYIGGDFGGQGTMPLASATYIVQSAQIRADAVISGDGGQIAVWGTDVMRFYGQMSTRGGAQKGDGGLIEASGANFIDVRGLSDVRAPSGRTGMFLIDPTDLEVGNFFDQNVNSFDAGQGFEPSGSPSRLSWPSIIANLGIGNVVVQTTSGHDDPGQSGNITVLDGAVYNSLNALRLFAAGSIFLNGAISNLGSGILDLQAGNNITQLASLSVSNLFIQAGGTVELGNPANQIGRVAGTAGGDTLLVNNANLGVASLTSPFGPTTLNGLDSTGGKIDLRAPNLTISLNGGVRAGTNIVIGANAATINGSLGTGGNVLIDVDTILTINNSIRAGGSITNLAASIVFGGVGPQTLFATNGNITIVGAASRTSGDLTLAAGDQVSLGALTGVATLNVHAGDGVQIAGPVTASGNIIVTNLAGNVVGGSVAAGGNVTLKSGGEVATTITGTVATVGANGSINLATTVGTLTATNQLGNITVRETDALTLGTVRAATGNVGITNLTGNLFGGSVTADGNVTLSSGGGVDTTITGTVAMVGANGSINLATAVGTLTATNQSGNITVRETDALTLGTVRAATGNVGITNLTGNLVGGSVTADGNVMLNSGGGVDTTITGTVAMVGANGSINLATAVGTLTATNQSGNITVRETDALTLGTVRAATGNVLIGSGNTITVGVVAALGQVVLTNQAGAMVGGVIVSDTGVIFRSLEGISMTVTAPVLQATSLGTGDIDLLTTVDRFSATNVLGDILVVDTTNLLLTGLSALDGDIDVRVLPGSVLSVTNVISTLPGAGGVLTINSGVVLQDGHSIQVGSGNITLEGGSIDIVVNGLMNVSVDTAMRALRDILVVSNGQIVVNGGANLSLYADRDGAMNDDGVFDAFGGIYLGGSGLDALNGGNIILSGHELARGQYETGIAVDPGTGLRIQSLLEGGSGSLLLSSISNVVIQAPVSTTGGNLSILSSAGSIQQQSTLTVGGAGTADLEALGSILMGTNVIQTSGGSVRLAAGDQVEIGLIDAGVGLVSILSGQGDIVTGDSGVLNVIAAGLCLEAGGSVGSNMDPFYTQVGTLAADAGGNLCLVEDNGLTVGTVGPVVVNRLLTNGSLIQVTNAALAGIGVATNLKLIVVGGDILITQEMHSGSDLLVFANGGNVTQDAMIHSTNGNISVLVNNNFGQNADISAGGAGSLDVNVGGTITMASGTQSQAGGNIRYGAGQDVLLGHLSGANVSVVAGRDILDNNAGANNATATGLRMQAGRNIATGADRLETSVDVLAAQAGGSIYVDEANGLTLGTVGPLSVNRVNANSTTTPVTDVLLAGARAGTNLKVTAGGTITVTLPVSAGRELLLETSSGDVIQNAILTSTNGNILASATNGAIFVNALITTEPGSGGTRTVIGEVIGDLDANILLGSGDITLIGRGTVFRLYGTNLAEIVNGELASLDKGTDFGRLMIPNTLVREFRIENAGNSQLILSNPSVGGTGAGQFALVQVPATVAAQESDIVIVRFQPTAAGVYGAYVSFESNTTNTPFSFGVSGFATAFEEVTDRTLSSSIVWEFDFRTGTFFGTLTLCNDADSDKPLWEPFWYLVASNQFHWLRYPDGVETNSGLPYVDVTGAVLAQLPLVGNGDDALDPGECVVVRGIELMGRREATGLVYAIWADPPGPGGLDTDGDGIPDAWEAANSPMSPFNPLDAHLDFDRDGVSNFAEWISGTDPNNPGSVLALTFTSLPDAEGIVLCWPSVAGRVYRIEKAPAVDGLFEPVTGVLNATPPENCVALPGESSDKGMYRIWVSMDEGGLEP